MKRPLHIKLIVALVFMLTNLTLKLHAQHGLPDRKISVGFSIGANVSTIPALNSPSELGVPSDKGYGDFIVLPIVGVNVEFKLQNTITLQTEANYTVKGGRRQPYSLNLRYIEIPASVIKNFKIGKSWFSAGVGAYAAVLTSFAKKQKYVLDDFTSQTPHELTEDGIFYNSKFKDFDYGTRLNLGYNASRSINIRLGYNYGLSNILKDDGRNYLNNQTIMLGLNVKLN